MLTMSILDRLAALRERVPRRREPGTKQEAELAYWTHRRRVEGELGHMHYEAFYTGAFGLTPDDYAGKRVLDIGCGPRGSLEWADMALERVGLDPLVDGYRRLGIKRHAMSYVAAGAEAMPFDDEHFDIVVAFNSLDHVDDVDAAILEMTRVTRRGGTGLLLVEVNHAPTLTEPQTLELDVLDRFSDWQVEFSRRTGIDDAHQVYESWRNRIPWVSGSALLGARLTRRLTPVE
jgi:SAM-dependent methyltransferase